MERPSWQECLETKPIVGYYYSFSMVHAANSQLNLEQQQLIL